MHFLVRQNLVFFKERKRLFGDEGLQGVYRVGDVGQASFSRIFHPLFRIIVPVEDDPAVLLVSFLYDCRRFGVLVFGLFHACGDFIQGFGGNSVQCVIRSRRSTGRNQPS